MVSFRNLSSEQVILSYWVNRTMCDVPVLHGSTINIDNCTVGEWIIFSRKYERIGKFWTKPSATGSISWIEDSMKVEYDGINQTYILIDI